MNKKDINNKNIIITEKKRIIRNNFLILLLALILSLVFIFYTNDFIIENSKSVHNKNISLQEKIDELKHNIAEKEKPDIIILGKQAIDDDSNQTGQMLSALLGWSQGTFACNLEVENGEAIVAREIDGGIQNLNLKLPSIILKLQK